MKAILLSLIFAATSRAQGLVPVLPVPGQAEIIWPAQCYGGYCQPPQSYPPQGWQPARPPQTTPPVGSNGTPQFTPRPPNGTPAKPIKECDCGPKWAALEKERTELTAIIARYEQRITELEARPPSQTQQQTQQQIQEGIKLYFEDNPQAQPEDIAKLVLAELDHDTPIRVYLPDGKLAGETKTNIFRGEPIEFTFYPRELLDKASGEQ